MESTLIVPTIFALDKKQFESKLEKLSFARELHIDFMDGNFTKHKSVSFEEIEDSLKSCSALLGVHLMVFDPLRYLKKLQGMNMKKVFLHFSSYEQKGMLLFALEQFKSAGFEVYLVASPQVSIEFLFPYLRQINGVMIMSVVPGAEGQTFLEETYSRIAKIRGRMLDCRIYVDGGISLANARKLIDSGATGLCVGSYISSHENPEKRYKDLLHACM